MVWFFSLFSLFLYIVQLYHCTIFFQKRLTWRYNIKQNSQFWLLCNTFLITARSHDQSRTGRCVCCVHPTWRHYSDSEHTDIIRFRAHCSKIRKQVFFIGVYPYSNKMSYILLLQALASEADHKQERLKTPPSSGEHAQGCDSSLKPRLVNIRINS